MRRQLSVQVSNRRHPECCSAESALPTESKPGGESDAYKHKAAASSTPSAVRRAKGATCAGRKHVLQATLIAIIERRFDRVQIREYYQPVAINIRSRTVHFLRFQSLRRGFYSLLRAGCSYISCFIPAAILHTLTMFCTLAFAYALRAASFVCMRMMCVCTRM